jgi:hypothetical protein
MFVLAHAGHWLVSVVYLLPVLGVGAFAVWQMIKDRRRERAGSGDGPGEGPPDDLPARRA